MRNTPSTSDCPSLPNELVCSHPPRLPSETTTRAGSLSADTVYEGVPPLNDSLTTVSSPSTLTFTPSSTAPSVPVSITV